VSFNELPVGVLILFFFRLRGDDERQLGEGEPNWPKGFETDVILVKLVQNLHPKYRVPK
jgi:hypothetical protein